MGKQFLEWGAPVYLDVIEHINAGTVQNSSPSKSTSVGPLYHLDSTEASALLTRLTPSMALTGTKLVFEEGNPDWTRKARNNPHISSNRLESQLTYNHVGDDKDAEL